MGDDEYDTVAILDAGAQYGKLIDRVVRELNIKTDLLPLTAPASRVAQGGYKAIIISGGPASVFAEDAPAFDEEIMKLGIPVFGICYGMQLVNKVFGGNVIRSIEREDGQHTITAVPSSILFEGLDEKQDVLLTHGDAVSEVAQGFVVNSRHGAVITGMESPEKKIYAVQFHPEVKLTPNGSTMLSNFLLKVAGVNNTYSVDDRETMCIRELKEQVGDKKVLVLVSGGVDSSVCAALLNKAFGPDRVVAVHVDNGFMRKDESATVMKSLQRLGVPLKVIDASQEFYSATTTIDRNANPDDPTAAQSPRLDCVLEPEQKRRIIGDTFMRVAEKEIAKLGIKVEDVYLAQGTLRPDLIESASKLASSSADAIKTHHNDTTLVRMLRATGRVVEPLKEYHKDEVRALGRSLGLAADLVGRQPFPGPGLAIRVMCSDTPAFGNDFEDTNSILRFLATRDAGTLSPDQVTRLQTAVSNNDCIAKLENFRATTLPIRTVGVQGDGRTYSYAVAVTCEVTPPPWQALLDFAKLVPRLCHKVNRVVYAWGGLAPGPVARITPTFLTPDVLNQLREADAVVNDLLVKHDLVSAVAQVPVVSVPVDLDASPADAGTPTTARSIVIRTFLTSDFMTGVPATPGKDIPEAVLDTMRSQIMTVPGITRVMYDLTAKPPGTTEWE